MELEIMPRSSSAHARLNTNADDNAADTRRHIELLKRLKHAEKDNATLSKNYRDLKEAFDNLQKRILDLEVNDTSNKGELAIALNNIQQSVEESNETVHAGHNIMKTFEIHVQTDSHNTVEIETQTNECTKFVEEKGITGVKETKEDAKIESNKTVEIETQTIEEMTYAANKGVNEVTETQDEGAMSGNIDILINKLEKQEREQNAWRLENSVLERVCESLASRIDMINREYTGVKEINEQLTKQVKDQLNEIDKREKEVEMLRNDKNKANDENKRLVVFPIYNNIFQSVSNIQ